MVNTRHFDFEIGDLKFWILKQDFNYESKTRICRFFEYFRFFPSLI